MCCGRDNKVYRSTDDDPLAQICNECKSDALVKRCIKAMYSLNPERRLQVIAEFFKLESKDDDNQLNLNIEDK